MTRGSASARIVADDNVVVERGVLQHDGTFGLQRGGCLESPRIAYELAGCCAAPVLLVLGGISATRHVASNEQFPETGWWEDFAGLDKPLDTRRYRVLSMDFLGGNGDTEGPRNSDQPIPPVTPEDQASLIVSLLDKLGIDQLRACIGASYGGMVALQLAALYRSRLRQLVIVGAAHRAPAVATALRSVQREAIRSAIRLGSPAEGLRLARAIGMVTYRSPEEFEQRFGHDPDKLDDRLVFPVENYLFAQGDKFASQFHPDAVLRLSESIDLQKLDPELIFVPAELFCARSDFVAPPVLMAELAERISGPVNYHEFDSLFGHDSFLKETGYLGTHFRRILASDDH